MNKHFMEITCYQTKNKAHEELQQFAIQYNRCLIDDENLAKIKLDFKIEIDRINLKYSRCKNIELSGWQSTPDYHAIVVDGNFILGIIEVKRFLLCSLRLDN